MGALTMAGSIARSPSAVLDLAPNAWLRCALMKSQASIAIAQCRLRDGLRFVEAARSLAHDHSLVRDGIDNQANLGYIHLLTGAFDQSARALVVST